VVAEASQRGAAAVAHAAARDPTTGEVAGGGGRWRPTGGSVSGVAGGRGVGGGPTSGLL
jgi:hypothetical protein